MKQVPLTEVELIAEIERLETDLRSMIQRRGAVESEDDRRVHDKQIDDINARIEFLRGQLEPS